MENNRVKHRQSYSGRMLILFGMLAGIGGVALFAFYLSWFGAPSDSREIAGQFGDFLGGALNPWFGFLALLALLFTIHMQSEELRLTREQFVRSSDALEEQSQALRIQNFESTYFHLLRLYHDLVDTMQFDTETTSCRGKACFRALADEWRGDGLQRVIRGDHVDPLRGVKEEYAAFYEKYRHLVGHYFRTLYNIIRVIEVRGADDTGMYFRLLRAQLSRYELELLFYNNVSEVGEGLGRRAAEHGLLSHAVLDKEAAALFADELVAMKDDEA